MKSLTMLSMLAASAMAATSNPCPAQTRPNLPDTPKVLEPGQSYDFESPKGGDAGVLKIAIPPAIQAYIDQKSAPPLYMYLELDANNGAGTGVKWNICFPEVGVSTVVPDKPCNSSSAIGTSSGSRWAKGDDTDGDLTLWYNVAANLAGDPISDTLYIFLNPVCDTTDGCIKTNEWNVNFAFTHAQVADSSSDPFQYWGYDNSERTSETPRSQFVLQNNVRTANFKTKINLGQDEYVYFKGTTTAANQPVFVNVRVPTASKGAQLQLLVGNTTHLDVNAPAYKFPQFLKNGNWENYEAPFTPATAGTYQMAIKTVKNDEVALGGWVKWTAKAGYGEIPCDSAATVGASALLFALIPLTWLANRM